MKPHVPLLGGFFLYSHSFHCIQIASQVVLALCRGTIAGGDLESTFHFDPRRTNRPALSSIQWHWVNFKRKTLNDKFRYLIVVVLQNCCLAVISASIFIPDILPCFNFCLIASVHGFQHDEQVNHSRVWELIKIPGFNKIPKEITEKFINIAWTNCCVGTGVHVW